MSKRRMFSQSIVESDAFLDMPQTSQNLYFHLGMNADDDGFVNPKRIVRMVGAGQDDLQVLIAKRFILVFDTGVAVVKHWPTNNFIRTDRYKKTSYKQELSLLTNNENGDYTEISKITTNVLSVTDNGNQMTPIGIPDDNTKVDPGKVRLSKVKLGKVNKKDTNVSSEAKMPSREIDAAFAAWVEIVGFELNGNVARNRQAVSGLLKTHGVEKLEQLLRGVRLTLDDRYAPRISDFVSLQRKLNDLIVWGRKKGVSSAVAQF